MTCNATGIEIDFKESNPVSVRDSHHKTKIKYDMVKVLQLNVISSKYYTISFKRSNLKCVISFIVA